MHYTGRHRSAAPVRRWSPSATTWTVALAMVAVALVLLAMVPAPAQARGTFTPQAKLDLRQVESPPAFGVGLAMYEIAETARAIAWESSREVTIPYIEGPDGTLHMRCSVIVGDTSSAVCSDGTVWPS